MNEQKFDIDRLRVASPCSMGWENMAGDERKRFCASCELSVYNISEMTADEVRELVAGTTGRVCGRIYRRADGTVMTKDCPTGLRAYRKRAARLAGAALTAVLGLFSVSFAQSGEKSGREKEIRAVELNTVRLTIKDSKGILTGTVTNPDGAVVPGAKVYLYLNSADVYKQRKKKRSAPLAEAIADAAGIYKFSGLAPGMYKLHTETTGFVGLTVSDLEIKENEQVTCDLELNFTFNIFLVGVVAVPSAIDFSEPGPSKTVLTREMLDRMPKRNLF